MLPWFYYAVKDGRTMFYFYVLPALPFLILAVVYVLGRDHDAAGGMVDRRGAHRPAADRHGRGRRVRVLVALCFAYFYPVFVGKTIPYDGVVGPHVAGRPLDLTGYGSFR